MAMVNFQTLCVGWKCCRQRERAVSLAEFYQVHLPDNPKGGLKLRVLEQLILHGESSAA